MGRLTFHVEFDVTFSKEFTEDWAQATDFQKAAIVDNWHNFFCRAFDEPTNIVGNIKVVNNGKELDSLYEYFQKREAK